MANITFIDGNLVRECELRYTPNGKAVINLSIANNHGFGDNKKTVFINVTAWGKLAEACQRLSKGSKVGVTGRLIQRSWQDKDGNNRQVIEIVANEIDFLSPFKEKEQPSNNIDFPGAEMEEEVYIPGEDEF